MSELAKHILVPPASLTRLIDRMVLFHLAYRKADTVDRRRVLVYATPRGRALHRNLPGGSVARKTRYSRRSPRKMSWN